MELIRTTLPTLSLKELDELELEIEKLKKYLPEYNEYLEKRRLLKMNADQERAKIADVAKDPMNQMARLLHAGHVHFVGADDEPLTYKQFVEEKERQLRLIASRPERYVKAIAHIRNEVAKQRESAVEDDVRAESFVRTVIPEKITVKVLVELVKEKGLKGYSGKKAEELRAMIATEDDRQIQVYKNNAMYKRRSADETEKYLELMIHYHSMSAEDLTKEEERIRIAKTAEQTRINELKDVVSRMKQEKKPVSEIKELIESGNKQTCLFNDTYKPIEYFVRDARKYQADGSFPALASACSTVDGKFIF